MDRTRTVTFLSVAGVVAAAFAAACINLQVISASSDVVGPSSQSLRDVGALGSPEIAVPRPIVSPTAATETSPVADAIADVIVAPLITARDAAQGANPVAGIPQRRPVVSDESVVVTDSTGGVTDVSESPTASPSPTSTASSASPVPPSTSPTPTASPSASCQPVPSPSATNSAE